MSQSHSSSVSQAKPATILVFDSGVGGLSVAREIQQRLPAHPLIYASDNAFFPYGTKGEDELIKRVDKVIGELLLRYQAEILVIACNTASTLTLPHLRAKLDLPVVGVVPAIKPAAQLTKSGVIGLLATPATVARPYTHELIREYAPQCDVISLGSSELVEIAEQKLRGESVDSTALAAIAARLMQADRAKTMDVLVLACTHFPLLREELAQQLPGKIRLIDSGEAIARRVEFLLTSQTTHNKLPASDDPRPLNRAVFTKNTPQAQALGPALAGLGIQHLDYLEI